MRKLICALISLSVLLGTMPIAGAVGTAASAAILMDADSGRVLYSHNIHERRLIASITKLMTALVSLESGLDLTRPVTVQPQWTGTEGSSIYLRQGEQITPEALLYGMLLQSGNDASCALAQLCCGSQDAFVLRMNEKAALLGMKNSSFANPHGLNAPGHYSTAYDMALLARACLENKDLARITATKTASFGERTFTNHNKLLWQYEGCIGLKTGYTEKAGRTLVSSARRDGVTLICVTLNDPDDWKDHKALFDYGFSRCTFSRLNAAGEEVGALPVSGSLIPSCPVITLEGVGYAALPGELPERQLYLKTERLTAPVSAGQQVGELRWFLDGTLLGSTPLVTARHIPEDRAEEKDSLLQRIIQLARQLSVP